ncbi:hypothetical protein ACFYWX_39680 [Streptomyces sp. NPDC002888]|uniref:hypothetical protein n=1 Tax=Streptomyces sp. NPDC002888 TaxID=3364668 RepID=UPI003695B360
MTGWGLRITGAAEPFELTSAVTRGQVGLRADVVLPSGLAAATLRLTVRGLAAAVTDRLTGQGPLVAELYLYGSTSAVAFDPAARVAAVVVERMTRHQGPYGPELTLDGIDEAYHRLSVPCPDSVPAGDHRSVAAEIGRRTAVSVQAHGSSVRLGPLGTGATYLEHLATIERRLAEADGRGGRGLALFRDGVLHVGARPAVLVATYDVEPQWTEELGRVRASRRAVRFGLPGDPRLRPGELVRIASADRRAAPLTLYVTSVQHTLDPEHGFTTVAAGVGALGADDVWDPHPVGLDPVSAHSEPAADPATAVARAIAGLGRAAAARTTTAEVGEVRAADGHAATVWRGLAPGDGAPMQYRRLDVQRDAPDRLAEVGHTTPFAWGAYGLVLPRYPGTRVLLVPRQGRADDAVDVGSVWRADEGPAAEAGDWWLHLPAGVPAGQRAGVADDRLGADPGDRASNDLTDADGNRVIEVGELTVRVGRKALGPAGTRPGRGDSEHAVTIEHADGEASLVITADGTITLTGKKLRFEAQENIEMKAKNVKVAVEGHMDVTG